MAKAQEVKKAQAIAPEALPEGFEVRSEDAVGFWNPEVNHRIQCVPLSATMFDSTIDARKVSILIFAKLTAPCKLDGKKDGEENKIQGNPGDLVGIWGVPGLRELRNLAEEECVIDYTGTEDIGKPSPMNTFRVASRKRGMSLPVSSDRRRHSAETKCWLDL